MTDETTSPPPWFYHAAGLLLLVIIAALTGLTLKYRLRALRAEAEVRRLRQPSPSLETLLGLKPGEALRVVPAEQAAPAARDE